MSNLPLTILLQNLFETLEETLDYSAALQSIKYHDPTLIHLYKNPGYPPHEVNQVDVHNQASDFLLLTETLLKTHQALQVARRELVMLGIQHLGKTE